MANIQEATLRAEKYDRKLKASDDRFQRAVILVHHDGSVMLYQSAFLMRYEDDWIICFTEHHGYHVYETADLKQAHELEFRNEGIETLI